MDQTIKKLSFSVILPVYFKEKPEYLKIALKSIWTDQILKPSEIIIVKDGPLTEDLDLEIKNFSKTAPVKTVSLPSIQGMGKALNLGLLSCNNEIVARMDSDDISCPDRFEKQINYIVNNPDIDILSSWIDEFIDDPKNIDSTRKLPEFHEDNIQYARKRCPLNHPAVVFKKSAVLAVGGYQPFHLLDDYYLWARMIMAGSRFYNFQESLLLFRFSRETSKRRGGVKHAIDEIQLQIFFRKIRFISFSRMLLNIFIRSSFRLFPNNFRYRFYKLFLRR